MLLFYRKSRANTIKAKFSKVNVDFMVKKYRKKQAMVNEVGETNVLLLRNRQHIYAIFTAQINMS